MSILATIGAFVLVAALVVVYVLVILAALAAFDYVSDRLLKGPAYRLHVRRRAQRLREKAYRLEAPILARMHAEGKYDA